MPEALYKDSDPFSQKRQLCENPISPIHSDKTRRTFMRSWDLPITACVHGIKFLHKMTRAITNVRTAIAGFMERATAL